MHGLNITTECNLQIIDFLMSDDLETRKYYPYRKVNNELYIHKQSNHPHHLSPSKSLP